MATTETLSDKDRQVEDIYGFLRGSVIIPPDFDLTAPICGEPLTPNEACCTAERISSAAPHPPSPAG
jgi:hypothetical protein